MPASFSHGVLGFLFKVVPESFFTTVKVDAPELDMEFHDQFLSNLALSETENIKLNKTRNNDLDLTKFVELLEFNRRWTYSGSLTTIPCSEGILWNVIEQIIPIRQSTMDKYNYFRKIEAHQLTNKGESQDQWLNEAKAITYPINGNSVV
jgi:carbonic anhydrase